jgi:hypothetical protein
MVLNLRSRTIMLFKTITILFSALRFKEKKSALKY